jgi:(S)-2-hydroxyglutarate dehydrogenase
MSALSAAALPQRADVVVVGGGIVGLATARELLLRDPDRSVVVLERERELAMHQTARNSGVVHAGIYYEPGSAKARLSVEGKALLEAYCAEHGIPIERVGKLVVAVDRAELPALERLERRARANGVPGLTVLDSAGIREREPYAVGLRALHSPTTATVDFRVVAEAFATDVRAMGGTVLTAQEVRLVREAEREVVVDTTSAQLTCSNVITCAGLWADVVAADPRRPDREKIVPFRGDYYVLRDDARRLVRGMIYPVADPRFPFLGIHITRRIDGAVWAGPNAVLALARSGYRRRDVDLRHLASVVAHPGFRRLALRFWRVGAAEEWRDLWKPAFAAAVRRFVPELRTEHLLPGPAGLRAQALDPDGSLVDDFRLGGTRRVIRVLNAPSPAATASLAIARVLADEADRRLA